MVQSGQGLRLGLGLGLGLGGMRLNLSINMACRVGKGWAGVRWNITRYGSVVWYGASHGMGLYRVLCILESRSPCLRTAESTAMCKLGVFPKHAMPVFSA